MAVVADRADNPAQRSGLGLGQAARIFFSQPSPRIMATAVGAAVGGRLAVGRWSRRDGVIPVAVVMAQPFTEWLIHVGLLHWRPRTVAGVRLDPLVARKHRAHHADPKDLDLVFVPLPTLGALVAGLAAGFGVTLPRSRALTALASTYGMLLTYEWTHFLIHSAYRPRHRPHRAIWRAHRNHHYRNEGYWFGVTMHLADRVLGTFPDRSAVAVSATARTLGADAA